MLFGPEVESALRVAAALVNTVAGDRDGLASPEQLADLLGREDFAGPVAGSLAELDDVRALRPRLGRIWRSPDETTAAELANQLLRRGGALPRLVHQDARWRVRLSDDADRLADRLAVESGGAFGALICAGERSRLKACDAPDCRAVLVDLSRNRSRRFCDTGNCGNRQHAAAYRARKLMSVTPDTAEPSSATNAGAPPPQRNDGPTAAVSPEPVPLYHERHAPTPVSDHTIQHQTRHTPLTSEVLIADPAVTSVAVWECGEPLRDARAAGLLVDDRLADPDGQHRQLRVGLVERLRKANWLLPLGWQFAVVEGYRPIETQRRYFDDYLATLHGEHPDLGPSDLRRLASRHIAPVAVDGHPPHSTGGAVDIVLCDAEGIEISVGCPLNATPEESDGACYTAAPGLSRSDRHNRDLLVAALRGAGLVNYTPEWWHWSYGDQYWALRTGSPTTRYARLEGGQIARR